MIPTFNPESRGVWEPTTAVWKSATLKTATVDRLRQAELYYLDGTPRGAGLYDAWDQGGRLLYRSMIWEAVQTL